MKFLPPHNTTDQCSETEISDLHSHLLLPLFESRQTEGPFGYFISQKFDSGKYSIQRHYFFIDQPTCLYAIPGSHMLTINYMLRGSPVAQLPYSGNILLAQNSCQLFYMPPVRHEIWFDKGEYECIHITFDHTLVSHVKDLDHSLTELYECMYYQSEIPRQHGHTCSIDSSIMRLLAKAIGNTKHQHRGNMELHIRSIITQLLLQYIKRTLGNKEPQNNIPSKIAEAMQIVRDCIHVNPGEHLTLNRLSVKCGIPVSFIKRHFPRLYGMPVSEYRFKYRMDKGMELLLQGECNVSEVSDMLGYSNLPAFCKAFKSYHRISAGKIVRPE